MSNIFIPQIKEVTIRQEGTRVIVISDGKAILDLPYDAAMALSRALHIKSLLAEEEAKALDIIYDAAILMRAGMPFGLTNREDMKKEIRKEAAWNSDLRKYMRNGIRSKEVFGTPTIINKGVEK